MILFLAFAAGVGAAEIDALQQSVARCDRVAVRRTFEAEPQRRGDFVAGLFREQEAIVEARLALAERRRSLRGTGGKLALESRRAIDNEAHDLEDRQNALNDRRILDGARRDALNQLRALYLVSCRGKDEAAKVPALSIEGSGA